MVIVFDDGDGAGDAPYLRWLRDHPAGFVVNSSRRRDPTYMVLHKVTCRSISMTTDAMAASPFAAQSYVKVCADDPNDLFSWIRQRGGSGFTKRCQRCGA